MIARSTLSFVILVSLFSVSCKRTVTGSGEIISDQRTTGNFETVEIRGAAEIEIANGTGYKVVVSGYENIVPLVETKVKDGKLIVSTVDKMNLANSEINIQITTPVLEGVTLSGAGDLVISSFHQAKMEVKLQGAGNVRFSNSECDTVYATLSGAGNMNVNAKNYLDATLNGVGNIEYAGDPIVKSKVSGIGNVTKK